MKKSLFVILLFFCCNSAKSQKLNSYKVDSLLHKYSKEHSIVGLSIGVVHNNISSTKSFGHTSFDSDIAISENTMFNIASITKLFTASAIMQLVEKGSLNLEDKLVDVLPAFKMKDKRHLDISIKHLLTHSSGLMWDNKLKNSPDDKTSSTLFLKQLESRKLNFTPGEKMSYETYSNVAFDLLGLVVERVSGQEYSEYIKEHIFLKVGMLNSTFLFEEVDSSFLALPQIIAGDSKAIHNLNFYGVDKKRKPILNGSALELKNHSTVGEDYEHNASGNIISCTNELNLFMASILRIYYESSNSSFLSKSSLVRILEKTKTSKDGSVKIALGWWVKESPETGKSYFHVGTNPGYCSILMIYPEKNLGITILCNGWYASEAIWQKLFYDLEAMYLDE